MDTVNGKYVVFDGQGLKDDFQPSWERKNVAYERVCFVTSHAQIHVHRQRGSLQGQEREISY